MIITLLFNDRVIAYTDDEKLAANWGKSEGNAVRVDEETQGGTILNTISLNPTPPTLD